MSKPLELAENWVHELWQRGNVAYADELCADNYTDFSMPDSEAGDCAALKSHVLEVRAAFPDLKTEVLDSFQDDAYVTLRILFSGTHESDYLDFAPSHKSLEWQSIDILHFDQDLLLERWSQSDLRDELEGEPEEFANIQESAMRADVIARLADVPLQVRAAIRSSGIHPASAQAWSTTATVGHLWRVERQVWQDRLQEMAREEHPIWEWWDPDRFDWESEFGSTDLNVLLDAFEFLRNATCNYLRDLDNEGWERRGTHRVYGELDVMGLMEQALKHDGEHLATLTGAEI